jgi:hypothetical protein
MVNYWYNLRSKYHINGCPRVSGPDIHIRIVPLFFKKNTRAHVFSIDHKIDWSLLKKKWSDLVADGRWTTGNPRVRVRETDDV